jgi:hypothetical protein
VRGNRYSVPGELCGALVEVRIGLDRGVAVYNGQVQLVARHRLKSAADGWVLVPEHHHILWDSPLLFVKFLRRHRSIRVASVAN